MHLDLTYLQCVVWPLLALIGALGVFALISPKKFADFADRSARWVDTDRLLAKLDEPIHVDHLILRKSRWLGIAVIAATAVLAFLFQAYVLGG